LLNFDRKYTAYPHLAGTDGERELGEEIYRTWVEQGLDYVTNNTYDILLSYPNQSDPNYVYLLDENGNEIHRTQTEEQIVRDDQNGTRVVPPFNAYSPAGDREVCGVKLVFICQLTVPAVLQLKFH
jgi:N-acetylated-alpha-linked acidic dipeptidase